MRVRRYLHQSVVLAMLATTAIVGLLSPATPATAIDTPLHAGSTEVYFDARTIGSTTDRDVYIYNYGGAPFGPLSVTGGEPPTSQFEMTNSCQGVTLPDGDHCLVTYSFTPDAAGAFTDTSMFTINGEDFEVDLAGFGAAANGTIAGNFELINALPASQRNIYVTAVDGSANFGFHNQPENYSVSVPPGTYCVSFGLGPWDGALSSYPGKQHCLDNITPVVVASAATLIGIDATLTLSSISGTVRDHTAVAVESVRIQATSVGGTIDNDDESDIAGAFTIGNLPAGTYCLRAASNTTTDDADGPCPKGTHRVELAEGANVTGADLTLAEPEMTDAPSGGISGTVTDLASAAQAGRTVVAESPEEFGYYQSTSTAADGTYAIDEMPAGQYCVYVEDDGSALAGETYADKLSCDVGDPVIVGESIVSGIDFALAPGGTITGTVTEPDGDPVTYGWVRAHKVGEYDSVEADLGAGGAYTMEGLSPGDYCIIAQAGFGDFPARTYGGGYSCERDVTPLTVAAGGPAISGIDIQLAIGGRIAGTVAFPPGFIPGKADGNLLISTRDQDGDQSNYVYPDLTGYYETEALAPGLHCLSSRAPAPTLLVSRVIGSVEPGYCRAGTISVTDSVTTTVDYAMELGGSISGWVISPNGRPDRDPSPRVTPDSGEHDRVRPDGSYLLSGVAPGTYCLSIRGAGLWSIDRVYDGAVSCDGPHTPITVVAGENVGNINFFMQTGGTVSGTVTRSMGDGSDQVEFHRLDAPQPMIVDSTNPSSETEATYRAELPPGSYCVLVRPHVSTGNANRAYGGTPSCVGATPVIVADRRAVIDIDITLTPQIYYGLAQPKRLLDTRPGEPVASGGASGGGAITGGTVREVPIGNLAGVPADAASVALNVTATNTTGPGYLTVYACGQTKPTASNVNYTGSGQTTPNAVIAKLGTDGNVCVFALTTADVIIDVAGYFPNIDGFTPLAQPKRLLDTRPGEPVASGGASGGGAITGGTVREVAVGGRAGLPSGAASVALNVTATNTTGPGYLTVYACGQTKPTASNVNYTGSGQTTPNAVIAKLGTDGNVCVFALTTADVIIDVAGYFPEGDGPVVENQG